MQRDRGRQRDDAAPQGDIQAFHRGGGQVGDHDGDHQLKGLKLSHLALAHQPHGQHGEAHQHQASDIDGEHNLGLHAFQPLFQLRKR